MRPSAAGLLAALVLAAFADAAAAASCPRPGQDDAAARLAQALSESLPESPPAVLVEIRDNRGKTREILARYEPGRAGPDAAAGWRVLQRNDAPVSPHEAAKLARHLAHDGPPMSAAALRRYLAGRIEMAERIPDADATGQRWRLRIAELGPGSVILKGEDLSGSLQAVLTISCSAAGAQVETAELALRAPRRLAWYVVLKDASGIQYFGRDEAGRTILLAERLEAVVDPLILKSFRYVYERRYRDHRFPLGDPGD